MKIYTPFLALVLILMAQPTIAQSSAEFSTGNIQFMVNANGVLGNDLMSLAHGCEVPAGSNTHAMFSAGLWIGGVTPDNQLRLAAQEHENINNGDYWPGPLTVDGNASISSSVSQQYDQVWTIYSSDIELHQAYFDCVEDPNCDAQIQFPAYQTPTNFQTWPAHGNTGLGQAEFLAPFFDRDQDGMYDPDTGDHPCVPGDEAKYFIFNDQKTHVHSGAQPLGLEVHAMLYTYATSDSDIDNTVFVHYRLINRSSQSISEAFAGVYTDFDLGNYDDDYVGYDVQRGLSYVYNGDNNDEDNFLFGYGAQPPAFGMAMLQGPYLPDDGLDTAPSDLQAATGTGFNDGDADNERYGPSSAAFLSGSNMATGLPSTAVERYNRLAGLWNDGSPMLYGGTGHQSEGNADPNTPMAFSYPDNSDPTGLATSGVVQTPWSEMTVGNFPSDRRMLTSVGPFDLAPGQIHEMDLAFVYARAGNGGPFASVQALQTRVDAVRNFYFDLEDHCGWSLQTGIADIQRSETLDLFPNPANGYCTVDVPGPLAGATLSFFDLFGREVLQTQTNAGLHTINLEALAPGTYLLEARHLGIRYHARIVRR